jgi:hypothetical protein
VIDRVEIVEYMSEAKPSWLEFGVCLADKYLPMLSLIWVVP